MLHNFSSRVGVVPIYPIPYDMYHPTDKFSGSLFLHNQVSNQLQLSSLLITFFHNFDIYY